MRSDVTATEATEVAAGGDVRDANAAHQEGAVTSAFVSYSHDSSEHVQAVLSLANSLRVDGLDVRLDKYVEAPSEGWPQWTQRQVAECDFVLVICTARYRAFFDGLAPEDAGGRGATWEAMIACQLLYEAGTRNDRLIPVLFEGGTVKDIPRALGSYTYYRLPGEYEKLYCRLTGQPWHPPPQIGERRRIPPEPLIVQPDRGERPWRGWDIISPGNKDALRPASNRQLRRFFDGMQPDLRIGVSHEVPRFERVDASIAELLASEADGECSHQLLLGGAGEGKSTTLLQVCGQVLERHGWQVFLCTDPTAEQIHYAWLDALRTIGRPVLFAIDGADGFFSTLRTLDRYVRDKRLGGGVHLMACARTHAWDYRRKTEPEDPFDAKGFHMCRVPHDFPGEGDLRKLIESWRKTGAGLRELEGDKKNDAELVRELQLKAKGARESFFGAVLDARFSPEDLVNHARDLVRDLGDRKLLRDAYAYIAAAEAVGFLGVHIAVLADLLSFGSQSELWSEVLSHLQEEAPITGGGSVLQTRHPKIAAAALRSMSRGDFPGLELDSLYIALVRQVIRTGLGVRLGSTYARTVHCGPRLAANLRKASQRAIESANSHRIAIAAASVAAEEADRCDTISSYGEALINASRADEAVHMFRDRWPAARTRVDFAETVRGMVNTWAVAEGRATPHPNPLASLFLALLSLSDSLNPCPIEVSGHEHPQIRHKRTRVSLATAGRALQHLGGQKTKLSYLPVADALRAVATLGELTDPDDETRKHFRAHMRDAERLGASKKLTPRICIEILEALGKAAKVELPRAMRLLFVDDLIELFTLADCLVIERGKRS